MRIFKDTIFIKGFIVGGTMIVPGVSGGTMAMILGVYDKLIFAISSFRKESRRNFLTLAKFAAGGGLGLLLFSTPVSWLLENYELPVTYFFLGAVFGGIPLIEKKSGIKRFGINEIIYMVIGTIIVLLISSVPQGKFSMEGDIISLLFIGGIAAVALILPGISISHLFLILGMYEEILNAIKSLNILVLLPLAAGVLIGTVLFSRLLSNLIEKYPMQTYLMILGFILGSIAGIFPGLPVGADQAIQFIICIGLFLIGFFIIYTMQKSYET